MLFKGVKKPMNKILAIETSTELLGVSAADDTGILSELTVVQARIHSEMLLPLCIQALEAAGLTPESVDCFAVSSGPGSFTGLRIGSATVQGLALALKKPVVKVPTFEVYLRQCSAYRNIAIVQGRAKGQTVCALYKKEPAPGVPGQPAQSLNGQGFWSLYGFEQVIPTGAKSYEGFCKGLAAVREPVWITGDAAAEFCRTAPGLGTYDVRPVDEYLLLPRPGIVGLIGRRMFQEGITVAPSSALPEYYRRSQAEVVFAKKRNEGDTREESSTSNNQ